MPNNKKNFENYSSGRVIYGVPGATNFSVRLVISMFEKCKEYLEKEGNHGPYNVSDQFCGAGYSLTVLGFMHNKDIKQIYASDIDKNILEFAEKNLSLLSRNGIEKRIVELNKFVKDYGKISHKEAVESAKVLKEQIKHQIKTEVFQFDILSDKKFPSKSIDIVITDVPYGQLTNWQGGGVNPTQEFLNKIKNYLNKKSIVALSYNKKQNISYEGYVKLSSIKVPKRKVIFLVPN